MLNFPTFESFDGSAADAALEPLIQSIEAAVRGVFPGARCVCTPARYRLGPPPHGLEMWFTFGAGREDYDMGIAMNDPLYHHGSVVPLRDGTGRVEVDFHHGGYMLKWVGRDRQRVKFGWRKTTCMPAQVPAKLAAYFARVKQVFLENISDRDRPLAAKRGMIAEGINESRGARGKAIGPMLDFVNPEDIPEVSALMKSDIDDVQAASALVRMGASTSQATAAVRQRGYFAKEYDADLVRLSRAANNPVLKMRVARSFSAGLLKRLGKEKMAEVVRRNKTGAGGTCASHDFCDANMVMDAAMGEHGYGSGDWPDSAYLTDHAELWSAAWDLAKENDFFV